MHHVLARCFLQTLPYLKGDNIMAKTYLYAEPQVDNLVADDFIVSNLSLGAETIPGTDVAGETFDGTKHCVAVKRFKVDELGTVEAIDEAIKKRFSDECSLQYALDSFLTHIMTRPNYKAHAQEAIKAGDFNEAQRLAQELLDNYEVGRKKAVGASVKAKAQKADAQEAAAAALGFTIDELIARAPELKADSKE